MKILVTYLPKDGDDDKPYMDAHEDFVTPPALGDFVALRGTQFFKVVQVTHCLARDENTLCVTVIPQNRLPHAAFLKSEESRDS